MIAEVAVDCPMKKLNKVFHYLIPPHLKQFISPGSRVIVPFGRQRVLGYVLDIKEHSDITQLKYIHDILDGQPLLDENMIKLGKWMAHRYITSLACCFNAMLPSALKTNAVEKYTVGDNCYDEKLKTFLSTPKALGELIKAFGLSSQDISLYIKRGVLVKQKHYEHKSSQKYIDILQLTKGVTKEDISKRAYRQHQLFEVLKNQKEVVFQKLPVELKRAANSLVEKGVVLKKQKQVFREPNNINIQEKCVISLTSYQKQVFETVSESLSNLKRDSFLLWGVTGSGKTEIYLRLAEKAISQNNDVIVLVPEIALTPLMVNRFKNKFNDNVAVLHSGLSQGEKLDQWQKIKEGKVKIVVGARSAVFAPFKNVGLIIIDEEHENTYKQEENPKYHTIEIAQKRLELSQGVLLLGSATPSIESLYRTEHGEYKLLNLPKRATANEMPLIDVVDMKSELENGNRSIFSKKLFKSIKKSLDNNEQVVLFLNRRGFSTTTLCRKCGFTFKCPSCDLTLTSHDNGNFLICHYCHYQLSKPNSCPSCKSIHLSFNGIGTEKLQKEVQKVFPKSKILRMDVDTMSSKDSYNKVYQQFADKQGDILIGTQMIAKGFDFPDVTTVGIIIADMGLNIPDFRSAEKTFQLVTQVAGRAGRGDKAGVVILQTYSPEHYSIEHSSKYQYKQFYLKEIKIREALNYPPFVKIIKFDIVANQEERVKKEAIEVAEMLKELQKKHQIQKSEILGPVMSARYKLRNNYRWQVMLKTNNMKQWLDILNKYNFPHKFSKGIRVSIDVEPTTTT
ncbi:primosomal protein N' [Proteinivorax tanatarense]|uniref:Replication restart protein PriA n=1 Tax=Proteinivorax tanatarense TaxID=1260629 RepID=A0AAU7VQ19_9FIRM